MEENSNMQDCQALSKVRDSFIERNMFMPEGGDFGEVLVRKAWDDIKPRLEKVRGYDGELDRDRLANLFSERLTRIQELEAANIGRLEELCKDACLGVFDCPGSTVTVSCHLGISVDVDGPSPLAQPVNYEETVEDDILLMIQEREVMDCIVYGMAHGIYERYDELMDKVSEVEPELPGLYKDLLTIYDALHLVDIEDFEKVEEKDIRLMGFSKLVFHGPGQQPTIDSYAICFPLLVVETMKAFGELFTSHGLPDDMSQAEAVLDATDCLEKEQWYHILGPVMWRLVFRGINEADTGELPYFVMDLAMMEPGDLRDFLHQTLQATPHAEALANSLFRHSVREMEYDNFNDEISRRNDEFNAGAAF